MTEHDENGAAASSGGPVAETEFAERAHWRRLGLLMDLNEAFPLPDGMYFDVEDGPEPASEPPEWTDEQLDRLKAEWERKRHGAPRLLTPLPRRVRLRLAVTSAVDHVAIWLVDRKQFRAAELLWRAFGMWRR